MKDKLRPPRDRHSGDKPAHGKPALGKPMQGKPIQGKPKPQGKAGAKPAPAHMPAKERQGPAFRRPSAELAVLYGFHCVSEALRNRQRRLLDLYATAAAAERLKPEIEAAHVALHLVEADDLSRRLGADAVHQGVLLEARPLEGPDLATIERRSGIVLVLDQITDPHNVGAILRSAAAFNVDAVVTTERHAPELSGVLAKAASGALEHVPVIEVVNLARAMEELGDLGYQRIGLDSEAPNVLQAVALAAPLALVLGAEGKGLRRLTRENCDQLARLDLPGAIKSLNVSNACAIALSLAQIGLNR